MPYIIHAEVKILAHDGGIFQRLTERERIVCHYLAMGLSNKEIAQNMSISSGTVKVYIHNIICKTQLRDRTQIALKWANQKHDTI